MASVILERAGRLDPVGAGIQLSPNAGHVIAALGLDDAIDKGATRPRRLTVVNGDSGRRVAQISYDGTEARYGAPYRLIHRGDLQRVLFDAVRADPRIEVRLAAAVVAAAPVREGERVRAVLGDGAMLEAPLLIGADGVGSAVRASIRPDHAPRASGFDAWRATLPSVAAARTADAGTEGAGCSGALPETLLALSAGSHIVQYPVACGELINFVAILPSAPERSDALAAPERSDSAPRERPNVAAAGGQGDSAAESDRRETAGSDRDQAEGATALASETMPAAARAALARHAWRDQLARVGDGWRRWPLFTVAVGAPWCKGRVALVGDAAHAMLPFMAQGGAMAIEDAAVLAAMVAGHGAGPSALAAYEAARKPRVSRVARESARTGRIYHLAPPFSLARDAAMRALGPRRLLARLDWLYGWRPPPLG